MNAINPITPRTATVYILQGDDEARLGELRAEAERLKDARGQVRTLTAADPYTTAADAANAFAEEAQERGVTVILRAVGRKTWRNLISANPPREGNEADQALGANSDDFEEALVPLSIASPVFESDEQRATFLDSLSAAQFGALAVQAWALNMVNGADPKALLPSVLDQS